MKIIKGNVTGVEGFIALGKAVGIKKKKLDLGVIYCDKICDAAAVYTQNKVKGAPLHVTMEHLKDGKAQAIVINSGVANVCTGKKGLEDAKDMAETIGKELCVKSENVLVASTGLIGTFLPMKKIISGSKGIKDGLSKYSKVAEAILTTDTVKKEICIKKENFTIGAVAKGSGMIHPNMATMLCFICTDAKIENSKLKTMLKNSVDESFNMTSIDMDTSTSDMCIIMANGLAGKVDEDSFQDALTFVCKEIAKKIAADGEGASKLIQVNVKNAKFGAKELAKSVVSSNLFKCAAYGNDPNWGRVLCTMGNSGIEFDELKVDMYIGDIQIVKSGVHIGFDYYKIKKTMNNDELKITINMNDGEQEGEAYGCDLTEEYVKINAHYHT